MKIKKQRSASQRKRRRLVRKVMIQEDAADALSAACCPEGLSRKAWGNECEKLAKTRFS